MRAKKSAASPVMLFFVIECSEDDSFVLVQESDVICEPSVKVGDEVSFFYNRKQEYKGLVHAIGEDESELQSTMQRLNASRPRKQPSFHADQPRKSARACRAMIGDISKARADGRASSKRGGGAAAAGKDTSSQESANKNKKRKQNDEAGEKTASKQDCVAPKGGPAAAAQTPLGHLLKSVETSDSESDSDSEANKSGEDDNQHGLTDENDSTSEPELTDAVKALNGKLLKRGKSIDINSLMKFISQNKEHKEFCKPLLDQGGPSASSSKKSTTEMSESDHNKSAIKKKGKDPTKITLSASSSKKSTDAIPAQINENKQEAAINKNKEKDPNKITPTASSSNKPAAPSNGGKAALKKPADSSAYSLEGSVEDEIPALPSEVSNQSSPSTSGRGTLVVAHENSSEDERDANKSKEISTKPEKSLRKPSSSGPVKKKYRPRYTKVTYEGEYFRFKKDDTGVAKLCEKYEVYVSKTLLDDIKRDCRSPTEVGRALCRVVFTDGAIAQCSPTGRPATGKGRDKAILRPPLHEDGIKAIFEVAVKRAQKRGWRTPTMSEIKKCIGDVLNENRYFNKLAKEMESSEAGDMDIAPSPPSDKEDE